MTFEIMQGKIMIKNHNITNKLFNSNSDIKSNCLKSIFL